MPLNALEQCKSPLYLFPSQTLWANVEHFSGVNFWVHFVKDDSKCEGQKALHLTEHDNAIRLPLNISIYIYLAYFSAIYDNEIMSSTDGTQLFCLKSHK